MGTLFFILSVVLVLALKVFRWKPGFLGKPESILGDRKKNAVLSLTTIIPSLLISTVLTSKVIARSEWFGHYFEKNDMAYFVTIPVLFVVTSLLLVQFWDRVLTFRDNLRVDKSEKTVKTKYQKNYGKGRVRYTSTLTKSKKKK